MSAARHERSSPRPRRRGPALCLLVLLPLAAGCGRSGGGGGVDEVTLLDSFAMSLAAKRLCSALWVSQREADDALSNSLPTFLDERARSALAAGRLRFETDEAGHRVMARWGARSARAGLFGDQGCVILPEGSDGVMFTPVEVRSALPPADGVPWPMGDAPPAGDGASPIEPGVAEEVLDLVFSHPEDHTAAFVALHRGRIVVEGYGPGTGPDTQLESWSMGKSVTATLVGILVGQGHFDLWDPAPVPAWSVRDDDPRAAIRIADLLRMSSGLFFTHSSDDEERLARSYVAGAPDHSLGYVAPIDVFQLAESRPHEHPPETVGRYRNCDPLILGSIVERTVQGMGESYLEWPQRALFDRIGIRRQVLETDVYGNFVLTGFDFGTGRNWARLGQLYLEDGVWNGERLLPEGFVRFVSSPAPAWPNGEYGGLFWVGHPALPEDAYCMRGAGGQEVCIVPSHDLVLVRLGHTEGASPEEAERRGRAYRRVVDAVGAGKGGSSAG